MVDGARRPVGEWIGIPLTFVLAGLVPTVLAVAGIVDRRLTCDEAAHPLQRAEEVGEPATVTGP